MEPDEWLGAEEKAYPLHLISNQPKTKLHSQMDNGTLSSSIKIKGHQPLEMNPDDANLAVLLRVTSLEYSMVEVPVYVE